MRFSATYKREYFFSGLGFPAPDFYDFADNQQVTHNALPYYLGEDGGETVLYQDEDGHVC